MSGTVVVQVCWKKPWKRWSRRTSMDFFMWMKLEDDPSNDSISQNSIWAHPFHLPGYSAESLQDTPWRRGADPCGEVWVEFLYPHLPGSMLIYQKVIYITRFCHEVATHFFFRVKPELLENAKCCVAFVKGPSGISTWDVGIHLQLHDQDGRRQTFSWIAFQNAHRNAWILAKPPERQNKLMNIYI